MHIWLSLLLTLACARQAPTPAAALGADPAVPEYPSLTPELALPDVDVALQRYTEAYGAVTIYARPGPDGASEHAEIRLGDSRLMLHRAAPGGLQAPEALGGSPVTLLVAPALGPAPESPDPFGHRWGRAPADVAHTVTVQLAVDDLEAAARFYEDAFAGRRSGERITLGDSELWLVDDPARAASALGGSPVNLQLYVPDADAAHAAALEAGATSLTAPFDASWGERYASVRDPSGQRWGLATPLPE